MTRIPPYTEFSLRGRSTTTWNRAEGPQRARELAQVVEHRFVARASGRVAERRKIISERSAQLDAQVAQVARLAALSHAPVLWCHRNPSSARNARFFVLDAAAIAENLRASLLQTRAQLRQGLLGRTPPSVVEVAILPGPPVAPRRFLNVAVALVLGLVAGIAVAFVADSLSTAMPLNPSPAALPVLHQPEPPPQQTSGSE